MWKEVIRSRMIAKRKTLTEKKVIALSKIIRSRLLALPPIKHSKSIGIYLSFRNEVIVENLLKPLASKGKKIFVPTVSGKTLKFAEIKSPKDTRPGFKGIREPSKKTFAGRGSINTFLVPGVAFDLRGYRLGWGRGHYDRFLSRNPDAVKIGVAYDFQIVKKIENESHDVKMDIVVTEKRILKSRP